MKNEQNESSPMTWSEYQSEPSQAEANYELLSMCLAIACGLILVGIQYLSK